MELKPDSAEAHGNLGNALLEPGEAGRSGRQPSAGTGTETGLGEAHYNLGIARKDQGKLDQAIAGCRRALEFKPDYAEAHNNLGVACFDQGRTSTRRSPAIAGLWS